MSNLKILVRGAYDIQKLRIQMGNRLVGNFKAKLGQAPSEPEDTKADEAHPTKLVQGYVFEDPSGVLWYATPPSRSGPDFRTTPFLTIDGLVDVMHWAPP